MHFSYFRRAIAILGFFTSLALAAPATAQNKAVCDIFGTMYVEPRREFADLAVYIEESEAFADLAVFREDNRLYADESGIWFFTDNPELAHYRIFLVNERNLADITIYYTDTRSFAGCR